MASPGSSASRPASFRPAGSRPRLTASPTRRPWCSEPPAAMASPKAPRSPRSGPTASCWSPRSDRPARRCAIGRARTPLDPTHIGRPRGSLAIVGLGPGPAGWRTPEADALAGRCRGLGRLSALPRSARAAAGRRPGPLRLRARRGDRAGAEGARAGRGRAAGRPDQLGRCRDLRHGLAGVRDARARR